MVKSKKRLLTALVLFGALACFCGTAQAAEDVIEMNFTAGYMEKHPVVQNCWLPWIKEVEERTNGRLKITFFNQNTLVPEREHLDATRKGQIAIGHHIFGMNQGRLPYSSVCDIPSTLSNSLAGAEAYWNMFEATPEMQAEFKGIKVLAIHSSAPNQFDMAKDEIKNVADARGKKMLTTSGDSARVLRAIKANPIVMPAGDFYLSLSRNMANGCMLPMAPLRSFKISEALTSISIINFRLDAFWMGMNQDLYDSLPADIKAVIDDTTGLKMSLRIGQALYDGNAKDYKGLQADGIVMNVFSDEERQKLIDMSIPPAREAWFKMMEQRKYANAQEIYDRAQKIIGEAEAKYGHLSKLD